MIQVFEGMGVQPFLIRALNGSVPHESYGSWENYFALGRCEIKEQVDGVTYYNHVNCNYILFPNNVVVQNFGGAGEHVMANVREQGWRSVFMSLENGAKKET